MTSLLVSVAISLGQLSSVAPPAELKSLEFLLGDWRGDVQFVLEGKPQTALTEWTFQIESTRMRHVTTVHLPGMTDKESRAFGWDARRGKLWSHTLVDPFPTPRVEWGVYKLGELIWLGEPWDVGAAEGPVESRATTTRDGAALRFRLEVKRRDGWEKIAEGRLTKKADNGAPHFVAKSLVQ